ncbi:hypothetical protein [Pseudomonas sp. NBRC 111140]|uniref:hypothetical protein n=1 Tax=Pseudomonas sp. NBRC 111140 TaxID=1661055 RepID=UPI0007616BB1|nr:hypothetical protein [Pseudomonas sp. NBRC 111140]
MTAKIIPFPARKRGLDTLLAMATGTGGVSSYGSLSTPQHTVPVSEHYDSLATGICSLLGTVDPRLIQAALAERASGQHTLH